MVKQKRLFIISLLLLMLTGCGMSEELTDWAAEKANDALEVVGRAVCPMNSVRVRLCLV